MVGNFHGDMSPKELVCKIDFEKDTDIKYTALEGPYTLSLGIDISGLFNFCKFQRITFIWISLVYLGRGTTPNCL